MYKFAIPLLCSVSLVACDVVGPNYVAPTTDVHSHFVGGGTRQLISASENRWWTQLGDPLLSEFVERGNMRNLDIQLGLERIRASQAAAGTVGVNGLTSGALSASSTQGEVNGVQADNDTVQVNANYVFDLFGGAARSEEQARANIQASQADVGVVRLAFMSQLINSYIQARFFQESAAITQQTIRSRRETLALVQQRRDAGEATELEVQQARANLASSEASLPTTQANFDSNIFAIATLLDEDAEDIRGLMYRDKSQPRPRVPSQAGIPADLIRNRPDIRSAERSLASATAAIGVTESQLYPSISLAGSIAGGTTERWSLGPSLNIPLLNRGVLKANLEVAESQARQAEIAYRQTVLTAVEEVQSAIALCLGWHRQLNSQESAERAAASVLRLSRESYRGGAITLTEVLDAERQLANSRLSTADALRNYTASWVQMHIATGQGWRAESLLQPLETEPAEVPVDPFGVKEGQGLAGLFNANN